VAPSPLTRWMRLLRAEANAAPFCSSPTRSEFGVLELKNFSQFVVICAAAAALPEDGDDTGPDDTGVEVVDAGAGGADELDDEPELLQAATASASARPSAGTRMIRRATRGNRIARP
jgi:hypothetical protein